MKLEPVTLEGRHVRLVPLSPDHLTELWEVAKEEELWRLTVASVRSPDDLRRYVEAALNWQAAGTALPFTTTLAATGQVVGSTRFGNASAHDRRVEIGWTWVGRPWRRTPVNTEAKYLMLRHAFETLGLARVELKTDALNERSQNAMLRIGATREGTLRKHMVTETGRMRDTVYFSILDDEWPAVKARLEAMLAQPYTPPDV
jgi:N-acetyltransferase